MQDTAAPAPFAVLLANLETGCDAWDPRIGQSRCRVVAKATIAVCGAASGLRCAGPSSEWQVS
jgi:hypothetical protein